MFFCLLFFGVTALISAQSPTPKEARAGQETETKSTQPATPKDIPLDEDEISLVIKGKIISITEKEIVYKENGSTTESRTPVQNVHFLRKTNGEYRFFAPAKPDLKQPAQTAEEPVSGSFFRDMQLFLTAGATMHLAENSDASDYLSGLAGFIARSKGVTSQVTSEAAKTQFQGFVEPRIAYKQFMLGLSTGYAALSQGKATVNTTNPLSLTLDGYFIPAVAFVYYRLPLTENLGLNLGLGIGAMFTSVKYSEADISSTVSQRYTAWNIVAAAKPEVSYKFDRWFISLSMPFYFAESRKVESGTTSLVNGDTGKVISPNLTGISFSIAVGYQLR